MKQVMVVRTDLKMGKGKIAAQCCHGSIGAYKRTSPEKIKKQIAQRNISYYLVVDAGRTQIPTSSVTVLGIGPDEDEIIDEVTGDLKLL